MQGTGLQLTSLDNTVAHFDFSGSGFATKTGWITAGEGLLIKDDGLGGSTIRPDELLGAQSGDGFQDLATLDTNGDGVIDANDTGFSQLKVWVDANVDGNLDPGELKSLSDLNITSISLSTTPVGQNINGDLVLETATFNMAGSSTPHAIAEVDFATSTINTVYTPPSDFVYAPDTFLLPQLDGYGFLPSLRISMSQNPTLMSDVQSFVEAAGSLTGAQFDAGFESLLWEWAGVSDVDPTSRGPNVDARHLAFLFAFYGIDPSVETAYDVDPNTLRGPQWESLYHIIVDQLEVRFASQIGFDALLNSATPLDAGPNPLKALSGVAFDESTDSVTANVDALLDQIVHNAPSDATAAAAYYDLTLRAARGLRVDLFNEDNITFGATFLSGLAARGVDVDLQKVAAAAMGFNSVLDEADSTGSIAPTSSGGIVYLGAGDKTVTGGSGNIYVYSAAGGNISLTDASGRAQLVLEGLGANDVTFERPGRGNDLIIVNKATGSALTVVGYFGDNGLASIYFPDETTITPGTVGDRLQADAERYVLQATQAGSNLSQETTGLGQFGFMSVVDGGAASTVTGTSGNDIIFMRTGDKSAHSGGGKDIFVYDSTGGSNLIDAAAGSSLVLDNIACSNVSFSRPNGGNDLLVTIGSTSEVITVTNQFYAYSASPIERFDFSDGTVLTDSGLRQLLLNQESAAASGSIYGYGQSNDTLNAGLGNKYMNGEGGNDTYVYASNGGNDIVDDSGHSTSTLRFSDIASTGVTLSRPSGGNNLVITVTATGKTVTVNDEFFWTGGGALNAITFSDGVSWTSQQIDQMLLNQESAANGGSIYGYNGNDTIIAGPGDKYMNGEGGNDTYVYSSGGGNDIVDDPGHSASTLQFSDIASTGVTLSRPVGGSNLVITVNATGKTVTVDNEFFWTGAGVLNAITFSDGVTWTSQQIDQMLLNQESAASGGSIYGYNGNDTLVAGPGDKYMNGEGGNDTYVYASTGDDDVVDDPGHSTSTLQFSDIASTGVTLSRPSGGSNLVITVNASGKTVTVDNEFFWTGQGALQAITFSDGVSWTPQQIEQMLLNQESAASGGSIYGYNGNDTLIAGPGDKYMNGEGGADTYIYSSSGGNDVIDDGGHQSRLVFTDIKAWDVEPALGVSAQNLVLTIESTGKTITVDGQFDWESRGQLQTFTFADGTVWTAADVVANIHGQHGTFGNDTLIANNSGDTLYGYGGNDTLIGGNGNDTLVGGTGSDTYKISAGGGQDTIINGVATNSGPSGQLVLGTGLTANKLWFQQSGNDLIIRQLGTTNTTTVKNWYAGSASQLGSVTTFDNAEIGSASISQLVVDLANYLRLHPAFDPTTATQLPNDPTFGAMLDADWSFTTTNADGSYSVTTWDVANIQSDWSVRTIAFAASGQQTSRTDFNRDGSVLVTLSDGTSTVTFTDTTGFQPWVSQVLAYNAARDLVTRTVTNRDGTLTSTSYSNPPPAVSVSSLTLNHNQTTIAASALFTAVDVGGQAITEYALYNTGTGGAHFVVNGATQGVGQEIDVTAAQLAQTIYQAGASADQLWVKAFDGQWSGWTPGFTVSRAESPPVITPITTLQLHPNQSSVAASSLFSASDPDGDAIVQYALRASGTTGGFFSVNGVAQPAGQADTISAGQLAQTTYQAGSGADTLWVMAFDGTLWSSWTPTITVAPNHAPNTPTVANYQMGYGTTSVAATNLFAVNDPDGDSITQYELWNSGTGGGYFSVNGVAQTANAAIYVSAAQLAQTTYHVGSAADQLWIKAFDGALWSNWSVGPGGGTSGFTVSPYQAPIITSANVQLHGGQASVAPTSIFSVRDPQTITQYALWYSGGTGAGYFSTAGVQDPAGQEFDLTPAQYAQTVYIANNGQASDSLWMKAYDGHAWSAWSPTTTITPDHVPNTPVVQDYQMPVGQSSVAAANLFTVSDPDSDPIVQYQLYNSGIGGGHFVVSGAAQTAQTTITVTAAQLAQTAYQVGSAVDQIWVRASDDGVHWGNWSGSSSSGASVTPWIDQPVVTSTGGVQQAEHQTSIAGASLFGANDPGGVAITKYAFWNSGPIGAGHFNLNGQTLAAGQENDVDASQLSQVSYVFGTAADTAWVKAYNGSTWSAWTPGIAISPWTEQRPTVSASNVTFAAGQTTKALASMFSVSTPDGRPITKYELWDTGTGGGHFLVNGVAQATGMEIDLTAGQLANAIYVSGSGTDTFSVKVSDGTDVSGPNWTNWTITSAVTSSTTINNADGTHTVYGFDTGNQNSWSYYQLFVDSQARPVSEQVTNHDGSHLDLTWDTLNQNAWSLQENGYDANWKLKWTSTLNDDGTTTFHQYATPIVLDLAGNGLSVTPLSNSTATFDMNNNGVRVPTAWAGAGNGILAIDLGADGKVDQPDGVIDQSSEISFSLWEPGATSDMAALRDVFDTNHNGQLDAGDALWRDFRVWADSNQNGITDAGELMTLDQLGITSIGLNTSGDAQLLSDGTMINGLSNFTRLDGTIGAAADVTFAYSSTASPTVQQQLLDTQNFVNQLLASR